MSDIPVERLDAGCAASQVAFPMRRGGQSDSGVYARLLKSHLFVRALNNTRWWATRSALRPETVPDALLRRSPGL